MTDPAGPSGTSYALPTGQLTLRVDRNDGGALFKVAARQNPKRGFLFVSTVLGRHIPVKPAQHRQILRNLALGCRDHLLVGPVLVMGFAETAIGLGAGVAEEIANWHGDTGYLPTTRHAVAGRVWCAFSEDHSHAPAHEVMRPDPHPAWDKGVTAGRTLVLVDDEMTTGRTMANLAQAMIGTGLTFDRVVLVSIMDWSEGRAAQLVSQVGGCAEVRTVSLLAGHWSWVADSDAVPGSVPVLETVAAPVWQPWADQGQFGAPRLGMTAFPQGPVLAGWDLRPALTGEPVLVVGTGEHVWQPFRLAEAFEAAGCDAAFCATTRSPIHPGDVIRHKMTFPDHFGLGVPMYLHNVVRADWDRVVVMTETGIAGIDGGLKAALAPCEIIDGSGRVHVVGDST